MSTTPNEERIKKLAKLDRIRVRWESNLREANMQSCVFAAAVAGCWSVPAHWPRFVFIGATLVLFVYAAWAAARAKEEGAASISTNEVRELRNDEEVKSEFMLLEEQFESWRPLLKKTWPYWIAMGLWILTLSLNLYCAQKKAEPDARANACACHDPC